MRKVETSWNQLIANLDKNNIRGAMRKQNISNWKTSTVSHFGAVKAAARDAEERQVAMFRTVEKEARAHQQRMKKINDSLATSVRPALVAFGAYTGVYAGGLAARFAAHAGGSRMRELYRQDTGGLNELEQEKITSRSLDLGRKYPSMNTVEIMELFRVTRNLMGDVDRASAIIEELVKSYIAIQSAQGTNVADSALAKVLRGIDNLGLNKDGKAGEDLVISTLDALTRAAQVEGVDFAVESILQFARRSKVAGPAMDSEFIGAVAPALIQDSGADQAGNALAMVFKSFAIGNGTNTASKRNREARKAIGILSDDGRTVIESDMLGKNPYDWVKQILVPALKNSGVDMGNPTEIAKEVGKLTGNTNASGILTRMITQQEQIDRSIRQYRGAVGIDDAINARNKDPFVAFSGLTSALQNLSAAVLPMETITSGLNSLTDGLNSLAGIFEGDSTLAKLGAVAGIGGAGFAAYKGGKGIVGLIAAGPELRQAAQELKAAARSMDGSDGKNKKSNSKGWGPIAGYGAALLAWLGMEAGKQYLAQGNRDRISHMNKVRPTGNGPTQPTVHSYRGAESASMSALSKNGMEIDDYRDAWRHKDIPTEEIRQAAQLVKRLDTTVTPNVQTAAIDAAQGKAEKLLNTLRQIGPTLAQSSSSIDNAFSDVGAAP
jgi:hypothetical protein